MLKSVSINLTISSMIEENTNMFLEQFYFLPRYWHVNELIWQEGLLVDFLQKKITDNWIKKFLIYSAYLFSERYVFEILIKAVLDFIITPLHRFSFFDFNNISTMFYFLFIIFFFIFYINLFYLLFFLMF